MLAKTRGWWLDIVMLKAVFCVLCELVLLYYIRIMSF